MAKELYFIPIIAKALQEPHVRRALQKAFRQIERLGTQEEYTEGFKNFELFMSVVYTHWDAVITDHVRQLVAEYKIGIFEGTEEERDNLSNIICSRREWRAEYLEICQQEAEGILTQDSFPVIAVTSEKGLTKEITFTEIPGRKSIHDILPGNYRIKLVNTGWMIWEGELTAQELLWSDAYKGENMCVAAGDIKEDPTSEIELLQNGELMLRTYARTEDGRIEIELTR